MNSFLTELLHSAVLWGSGSTLFLWWLRRRSKSLPSRLLLLLPFWWLAIHTAIAWYGLLLPPSGRLIDADSGEPIRNARVIATWHAYPMAIWTSYCSGRQAHLTDAEGGFAFRFAPYPTLVFGTMLRGINPQVPGRIDNRAIAIFLKPIWEDIPIQRYAPGRWTTETGPNTECKVDIAPQHVYSHELLPGEVLPFDTLFREACIEQQESTFTADYLKDLMRSRPYRLNEYSIWVPPSAPPLEIQQAMRIELAQRGCPPIGNLCVQAIKPELHAKFCSYLATQWVPAEK